MAVPLPNPSSSCAAPKKEPPAGLWHSSFTISGRIALVSIVFSCMLTTSLIFAPSCAFAAIAGDGGNGACGGYVFAISHVADFMTWALVLVLVENICSEGLSTLIEVLAMRHAETLHGYMIAQRARSKRADAGFAAPAQPAASEAVHTSGILFSPPLHEGDRVKEAAAEEVYSDASTHEAD